MGSFMHGLWLQKWVINPKVVDPVSHWCEKDVTLGCEEHLSQVRFGRSETSRTRRGRRLRLYPLKVALSAPKTSLLECLGAAALSMATKWALTGPGTVRVAGAVAPCAALGEPRTEAGGCKEARNGVLGVRRAPKLSYIGP